MDVNKTLLQKYYQGRCNAEEEQMVEEWLLQSDDFNVTSIVDDNTGAKARMWNIIRNNTVGGQRNYRRLYTIAACFLLAVTTGIMVWGRQNQLPAESAYIIIDNTGKSRIANQQLGNILLSESANSGLKHATLANDKECMLFTNYLVINNQQGEDIWVYLKTSSEKGSGMMKFLCKAKQTYVAGYITEHSNTGNRKYLYSKASALLPEGIASGINSQLNAAQINAKYKGNTTIIYI